MQSEPKTHKYTSNKLEERKPQKIGNSGIKTGFPE